MRAKATVLARRAFGGVQSLATHSDRSASLNLVAPQISANELEDLRRRAAFYFPAAQVDRIAQHETLTASLALDPSPILLFGAAAQRHRTWAKLHSGVFDVDWRLNPREGWNWIDAATWSARHEPDLVSARSRFKRLCLRLRSLGLKRCYLFGTGPSLGSASTRDWSDGIRVACNTIVRDRELWRHISPHIVVAGDGIYHFGFTEFAKAFRRDLRARLSECPEVAFVYPADFDLVVQKEMPDLAQQLIPIPVGVGSSIHDCLGERFELPGLGNVLNLLLLPVGCALSKRVGLWGFDGRAPADKLFWANSPAQSYTELLPTLQAAHPAFFDHHVPRDDPEKYLRAVHGDVLEDALSRAERQGWVFEMLHPTWTPTLARRAAEGVAAKP